MLKPAFLNKTFFISRPFFRFSTKSPLKVEAASKNDNILLSLVPPDQLDGTSRSPATVVAVIDVSGSMSAATGPGSKGEDFGFSTLDLVKHSLRTIVKSLSKNDRLSLVSFSSKAHDVLELTTMDENGRDLAMEALNGLSPSGGTNLWDGLFRGMELVRKNASDQYKNAAVLLLTDGMPTHEPPRGYVPQLEKYLKGIAGGLPGIINTFGFGYSLDSKLLNDYATLGRGTYGFIPDGSMVGTIFVNSISNLLSNVAGEVELELDISNLRQDQSSSLLKRIPHKLIDQNTLNLKLNSIIFGQKKSIVLPFSFKDGNNQTLQGKLKYKTLYHDPVSTAFSCKISNNDDSEALISRFRLDFANALLDTVDVLGLNSVKDKISKTPDALAQSLQQQTDVLQSLIKQIDSSSVKEDAYVKDLLKDMKDQVLIALSRKDYYYRWGQHYLPSLAQAHLWQQCNNFKDPGVQHFGGQIFNSIRDKLDEIFLSIPPPKPSVQHRSRSGSGTGVEVGMSMRAFYDPNGVCFAGECVVMMKNGTRKLVKEIRKGDVLATSDSQGARVKCVIKTLIRGNLKELVWLEGGLKITPWHPIKVNNAFVFPKEIEKPQITVCGAVYNFVLEEKHLMIVNGVECVTLGHGFQDNEVVRHEYFGSEKVIRDLEKWEGWENGIVEVESSSIQRDRELGHVNLITVP